MKRDKILHYSLLFTCILFLSLQGCKKLVEVDKPINKYVGDEVYNSTNTAVSVMSGIYAAYGRDLAAGKGGISLNAGLMADEYGVLPEFSNKEVEYTNNIKTDFGWGIWEASYKTYIYRINSMIEGVIKSEGLPENVKRILLGEAKFTRALIYFYLVNFYGDVPIVLTTDFKANSSAAKKPQSDVYKQIIADLIDAGNSLPENYLSSDLETPTLERVRPNRYTVSALLSRTYLYNKDWANAEAEASKIINNTALYGMTSLNEVFLKNSKETIWQLQPNPKDQDGNTNTLDGLLYIPAFENPFSISKFILDDFEAGDKRRENWVRDYEKWGINYTIPFKYKVGARIDDEPVQSQVEYLMVFRVAEQYLIRAEARAYLNNLEGAKEDLNVIRNRAGLSSGTAISQNELLEALEHERRVELFTEWGHRWFDLKRWGRLNAVMNIISPLKQIPSFTSKWSSHKALLPIPSVEFQYNPMLKGAQNPGYSEFPEY